MSRSRLSRVGCATIGVVGKWELVPDPQATPIMRLAPDRILYKQKQHPGRRVYRWSICDACGRLWYTLDTVRNVIKRDGCSHCQYPGETRLPPKKIRPRPRLRSRSARPS